MKKRIGMVGALVLVVVAAASAQGARQERETIFERLDGAERRAGDARDGATWFDGEMERSWEAAGKMRADLEVAERATLALRDEAARQQVAWSIASRRASRASVLGGQDDHGAQVLLERAAKQVMSARRDDYVLVAKVRGQRDMLGGEVQRGASAAIARATLMGLAQASDEERRVMKADAMKAPAAEIERDLAVTSAELGAAIEGLDKLDTAEDFHRLKGTLIPPVAKRPAHTYGARKRKRSGYVRHTGYTYAVDEGTKVKAVARGLVVHVGVMEGFGKLVIIDHGSGYHTVHAHLGETSVRRGARVSRGSVLGASGQSGSLEGPKLYFELRKGGMPIDPGPWFVRR